MSEVFTSAVAACEGARAKSSIEIKAMPRVFSTGFLIAILAHNGKIESRHMLSCTKTDNRVSSSRRKRGKRKRRATTAGDGHQPFENPTSINNPRRALGVFRADEQARLRHHRLADIESGPLQKKEKEERSRKTYRRSRGELEREKREGKWREQRELTSFFFPLKLFDETPKTQNSFFFFIFSSSSSRALVKNSTLLARSLARLLSPLSISTQCARQLGRQLPLRQAPPERRQAPRRSNRSESLEQQRRRRRRPPSPPPAPAALLLFLLLPPDSNPPRREGDRVNP